MRRIVLLFGVLALLIGVQSAQPQDSERIGDAWSDPRNPIVAKFGGERLDLWSLKPVVRPTIAPQETAEHPVDQLIARNNTDESNSMRPRADRRTLARRLGMALTGLAPSDEVVRAFEADDRVDAYERLVDAFMQSPAYGEHLGRMWLDVVRYSDSNGFDWDEFRPTAWRFRDYVVRSFNEDKPFDRFVLEQLAGDEIAADPPQTLADQDALIATGYLRLGPFDNAAPLFNEQDRSRAELEADLAETTASAFLAMTLSCCRCHDHKTDPLSHDDHYRLRAFFAKVKFADDRRLNLAEEQAEIETHNAKVQAEVDALKKKIAERLAPTRAKLREKKLADLNEEERKLLDANKKSLEEAARKERDRLAKKVSVSDSEARKALSEEERAAVEELDKQVREWESRRRSFMHGLLMTDDPESDAKTFVFEGGEHRKPLHEVSPGFVSILDPNPAAISTPEGGKTTGRRLALARWIASPQNPLTARVLVNRLWLLLFGEGLVSTPNDFGYTGAEPENHELLDYLASELVESGWSVKHVIRLIVTSKAFQQECDLKNERGPFAPKLRRLSAEQQRDAVLAASGLLLPRVGGPPVWPELPPDLLNANPALLDDNASRTKGWYPSPVSDQDVRSLYLIQKRTVKAPFLETFDLPDNAVSCGRRLESIAAPQSLTLLNGELMERASEAMAQRILREARETGDVIGLAFARALQRAPSASEREACEAFLQERSLRELCRALLNTNEFCFID